MGVALASPGLLGALSQADKLFKATQLPQIFGYAFGIMECAFLLSIVLGLVIYGRLNTMIGLIDTRRSSLWIRSQYDERLKEDYDDHEAIGRHLATQRRLWDLAHSSLETLDQFNAGTWRKAMPKTQKQLLIGGYLLFAALILTSDFFTLVQE